MPSDGHKSAFGLQCRCASGGEMSSGDKDESCCTPTGFDSTPFCLQTGSGSGFVQTSVEKHESRACRCVADFTRGSQSASRRGSTSCCRLLTGLSPSWPEGPFFEFRWRGSLMDALDAHIITRDAESQEDGAVRFTITTLPSHVEAVTQATSTMLFAPMARLYAPPVEEARPAHLTDNRAARERLRTLCEGAVPRYRSQQLSRTDLPANFTFLPASSRESTPKWPRLEPRRGTGMIRSATAAISHMAGMCACLPRVDDAQIAGSLINSIRFQAPTQPKRGVLRWVLL